MLAYLFGQPFYTFDTAVGTDLRVCPHPMGERTGTPLYIRPKAAPAVIFLWAKQAEPLHKTFGPSSGRFFGRFTVSAPAPSRSGRLPGGLCQPVRGGYP